MDYADLWNAKPTRRRFYRGRPPAVPRDGEPITTWPHPDQAWLDVVRGLRQLLDELAAGPAQAGADPRGEAHRHRDGSVLLHVPTATYPIGGADLDGASGRLRRVALDAFWIGKHPVTNAQYRAFLEAVPGPEPRYWSDARFAAPEQPVVGRCRRRPPGRRRDGQRQPAGRRRRAHPQPLDGQRRHPGRRPRHDRRRRRDGQRLAARRRGVDRLGPRRNSQRRHRPERRDGRARRPNRPWQDRARSRRPDRRRHRRPRDPRLERPAQDSRDRASRRLERRRRCRGRGRSPQSAGHPQRRLGGAGPDPGRRGGSGLDLALGESRPTT